VSHEVCGSSKIEPLARFCGVDPGAHASPVSSGSASAIASDDHRLLPTSRFVTKERCA
jgi:hypothetical protein